MAQHLDMSGTSKTSERGFTLVELMIAIAVLAILAAIAYPNYTDYVTRSNRTDAKSMLSQVASRQEQFFLNNKSYTTGLAAVWDASGQSAEGFYVLSIADGPTGSIATSYELTAQSQGRQAKDTDCDAFTLDSRGNRGADDDGGADSTATCW